VTAIFARLGVDYEQWKVVTRTLLRTDFRLPLGDGRARVSRVGNLFSMTLLLTLFGSGAAMLVWVGHDVLLTGTLALAYLSVMLATALLAQHGMTMLSAADYVILGSRPVSSRTFMAIRATNVLFHALVITTLMSAPVIAAYTFGQGVRVGRGVAATLAIYAWAALLTLAIVASYGLVLRFAGASRVQRGLGYMQLAAGFLIYGGLFAATRAFGRSALANATAPDEWWLLLIPPAWFASYIELSAGSSNSTTIVRAAVSVAALLSLIVAFRGKLGMDYARRLSELPHDASSSTRVTRTPLFARGEARAAALLVLAHFRHDMRTRLGILAILPLILLNVFVDIGPFDLLSMAVLLFPGLVTRHFASSDTPHASWIYHATPALHGRLIIAVKNVAVLYFLLPLLAVAAVAVAWRSGSVSHALVHATMLGAISHLALQGATLVSPRLPFALPPDKTRSDASLMVWMVVVILGGQLALTGLERWVYVEAVRTAATLVVIGVVSWGLNAWQGSGIRDQLCG
jgi:hypothetical protein